MGCFQSKKVFVPNDMIPGQEELCTQVFNDLGFGKKEVDFLFNTFCNIDMHHVGSIRPIELFTHFNIELGEFEEGLFTVFDEDKSGKLTFLEFVCAMWNLLSMPTPILGALCYLMKDPTGVMRVRYTDMRDVMEFMHNKKVESSPSLQAIMGELRNNYSAELSISDICKWTSMNVSILSPLIILQLKLRKQMLGEKYWMRVTDSRKSDQEKGSVEQIRAFLTMVRKKSEEARRKREVLKKQQSTKGRALTESQKNIQQKQAILMESFNMGQAGPTRANSSANTAVNDEADRPTPSRKRNKPENSPSTPGSRNKPENTPSTPGPPSPSAKQRPNSAMASNRESAKPKRSGSRRFEVDKEGEGPSVPSGDLEATPKRGMGSRQNSMASTGKKSRPRTAGSKPAVQPDSGEDKEMEAAPSPKVVRKSSSKSKKG